MFKKLLAVLLAVLLLVGIRPMTVHADTTEGVILTVDANDPVVHDSFDDAINAIGGGTTVKIELTKEGPYTSVGYDLSGLNLTIFGTAGIRPILNFNEKGFRFSNGVLHISNLNINMTPTVANSPNYTFGIGANTIAGDTTVTLDNVNLTLTGPGEVARFPILMNGVVGANNTFNIINGSNVHISGFTHNTRGNGIYTEKEAIDTINVTDSSFTSVYNRGGIIASGTVYVNVTRGYFDISNNRGNGSNGGIWTVTENSKIVSSNNGAHGLSVTKLTVDGSNIEAHGNGGASIWVNTPGLTVTRSIINVTETKGQYGYKPGSVYLHGGTNTIDGASVVNISNNFAPGIFLNAGTLTVAEGSGVLTIKDNHAHREDATIKGGGGIVVFAGQVDLPSTAVIYNNRGLSEADDLFVNDGAKLTLYPVGNGWYLNEDDADNHLIDGWYHDDIDRRWLVHSDPVRTDELVTLSTTLTGPLSLKAAHTMTSADVEKIWASGPEEKPDVVLSLLANGAPATDLLGELVAPVTLVYPVVTHTFSELPKHVWVDGTKVEIVYSVTEADLDEYTKVEDGLTVTNEYIIPRGDITANKVWIGGPEIKPDIKLQLYRNDVAFGDPVVLEHGTLEYTWKDLELETSAGVAYVFTVKEVEGAESYKTIEDGLTVTNEYIIPRGDVTANKVWIGGPEVKPDIKLQLYRDDVVYGDPVVLEHGTLEHTWKNLELETEAGVKYVFTVREVEDVESYKKLEDGLTITNTYIPPEKPEPPKDDKLPPTGFDPGYYSLIALGLVSAGGYLILRKKKEE